jgi:DNA repair photolyase
VARTFDTPGFAGMTFYEIRAKSIINRVPGASRLPFEWTVNPYRGCGHSCVYCLAGDTRILMSDGRTKPLADLAVGDRIYGTVREGGHRRYAVTEVLAHWSTVKAGYRLTLRDGTQLVASGDHRFLTERGWKHVTGQISGRDRRPFLTTANKLAGVGRFAEPPQETDAYRRGYLSGLVRGDVDLATHTYPHGLAHWFRLAHSDTEALRRSAGYLSRLGIRKRRMDAVRSSRAERTAAVRELISWPGEAVDDWHRGFLAGLFDAEGSRGSGVLRISNLTPEVIQHAITSFTALGFTSAVEVAPGSGTRSIRLLGGLREQLRFLHRTDPAITRKRTIEGAAVRSDAALGIIAIEPLGFALPLYDITTGTGDFIANGVVSHNCFARNTHTYLDLDAGRDFDTKVIVKVNSGELLRKELAARKWRGDPIAMGTNVDCYQRAEGRYRLMREIIAALRDFANPFSILTKGTLITRDLDLLRQAATVTDVGLSMSIGFVDEPLWRSVEPGTPGPRRRLDAVRQLSDAGFAVSVLMAPILPGLTDTEESIDATAKAIAAAGAVSITPIALHLRPGAREWYQAWLAREHPRLLPRYRELFGHRTYLGPGYQRELAARVRLAAARHGLRRSEAHEANEARREANEARYEAGAEAATGPATAGRRHPAKRRAGPEGEQLTLL